MGMLGALTLNTNQLSLSALLGTTSSQSLLDDVNARSGGNNFFGSVSDPFRTGFQNFMVNVVQPIREVGRRAASTAKKLFSQDVMRPIDSVEELKRGIPPCMQMPIAYYPPIRTMIEEERIDGFGIDPRHMDGEDIYQRPLNSGYAQIHSTLLKNGEFKTVEYEDNYSPVLTMEEKEAIRITREFIDQFMSDENTSCVDFTDYPSLHA